MEFLNYSKVSQYIKKIIFLLGNDKKKIPWLIFLFLFSSLLDIIGLSLIIPYIDFIVDHENFAASAIYPVLANYNLEANGFHVYFGGLLVIVFFIKSASVILINKAILKFGFNRGVALRKLLMKSYQNLPYTDFLKRNSSEYIHSINSLAVMYSNAVLVTIMKMMSNSIIIIVILIFLAFTSLTAIALLAVLLGIFAFIYNVFFLNSLEEYGRLNNKYSIHMLQNINEGIKGLKEIRVLGREQYFYNSVKKGAEGSANVSVKAAVINSLPGFLVEFILVLFVVILVIVSVSFGADYKMIIPLLSVFGIAAMRLIPLVNFIISGISQINFAYDSINLLYFDLVNIKKIEKLNRRQLIKEDSKVMITAGFRSLELKKIYFTYDGLDSHSISNASIVVKRGDSIGFIGASGSGKTTLIDIMLGLLIPEKGEILYNNTTLNQIDNLHAWRSQIAYIPQEVFLIDDTLRQNVALGVTRSEINEDKLKKALKQSKLVEFVSSLPLGLDTVLGEGGIRISGGQRQRVALARAFYHERDVIVMDEATSALDNETEKEIIEEINNLKGVKTIIVIAHRLTTVKNCDQIYKMSHGKIIKYGTFSEVVN